MSEDKRFTHETGWIVDNGLFYYYEKIIDNLQKNEFSDGKTTIDLLNKLWEQTQRFEKHNQELVKEIEELKEQLKRFRIAIDYFNER